MAKYCLFELLLRRLAATKAYRLRNIVYFSCKDGIWQPPELVNLAVVHERFRQGFLHIAYPVVKNVVLFYDAAVLNIAPVVLP